MYFKACSLVLTLFVANIQSTNDINVTSSTSQIFFTKIGKLLTHVSYATLRIKVNLQPLIDENEELCKVSSELQSKLRVQLTNCVDSDQSFSNLTLQDVVKICDENVKLPYYIDRPWKNVQMSKLIKSLLDEMSRICEENKRRINEIQEIFHLKPASIKLKM